VAFAENREVVRRMRPASPQDWLVVAGDVAERFADVQWALQTLRPRFAEVVWVPGNHELWTPRDDPVRLRGERRYRHLVALCRSLGVHTPEDEYPLWTGPGGPATVVPLFLGYDYSVLPDGAHTAEEALELARRAGVSCTDELLLHPDPYPSRSAWCAARLEYTRRRLDTLDPSRPVVFVNHYPLHREPTLWLANPEFAPWCGTTRTADWHVRHRTAAVVHGHLHIPRSARIDGVRFEEVSLGYPSQWRPRGGAPGPRVILPA
jgi:3',5'-cyclic AMP phosphodiesterase CpdA